MAVPSNTIANSGLTQCTSGPLVHANQNIDTTSEQEQITESSRRFSGLTGVGAIAATCFKYRGSITVMKLGRQLQQNVTRDDSQDCTNGTARKDCQKD
jgi:hypothetical protein